MLKKKLKYCLGMLVYSSHYNDRRSNEGETCLYVCFTMVGLGGRVLGKKNCVQFAISSGGIITLIYSEEAFYCSTFPGFWGLAYSNSLLYMCSRTDWMWGTILRSIHLQPFIQPFGKHLAATNTVNENVTGNTAGKLTTKHNTPVAPCSWTTQLPSLPFRQKPWGKIIK